MQSRTTWIREHVQHIKLFLVTILSNLIGLLIHPSLLPLLFNLSEVVFHRSFTIRQLTIYN